MKRYHILTCITIFFANLSYSQDIFLLQNGSEINAKLIKIDRQNISFQDSGKTKFMSKDEVFRIVLQNGEKIMVKPETVYPTPPYNDRIIFSNGEEQQVDIISMTDEKIKYTYNNTDMEIYAGNIQFIKLKDGRVIKGIDLLKFDDKIIFTTGEELENIKYLYIKNDTIHLSSKKPADPDKIPAGRVFIVKLGNGEKIFPGSHQSPEPSGNAAPSANTPDTKPSVKTPLMTTPDKIRLKSGRTIHCKFLSLDSIYVNYIDSFENRQKVEIEKVSYILDENNVEIPLAPSYKAARTHSEKPKNDFRNLNVSLAVQQLFGTVNTDITGLTSSIALYGCNGVNIGYRMNKFLELDLYPHYSQFSWFLSDKYEDAEIVKSQITLATTNRLYLTKRFCFSFTPSVSRDIAVKSRSKPASSKTFSSWENWTGSEISDRFHLGFQVGFGWKGRYVGFDLIYQNLDVKGTEDVGTANADLIGLHFEVLLFNSNKSLWHHSNRFH